MSPSIARTRKATALLWTIQALLAVVFLAHGLLLLFPPPEIAVQMNASLARWFQVFLGVAEVLAAVGLTLPGMTGICPWLASWAAAGIILVMIAATLYHLRRGEYSSAATTVVLLAMAAFVARARRRA
jgi:hypothetical protein